MKRIRPTSNDSPCVFIDRSSFVVLFITSGAYGKCQREKLQQVPDERKQKASHTMETMVSVSSLRRRSKQRNQRRAKLRTGCLTAAKDVKVSLLSYRSTVWWNLRSRFADVTIIRRRPGVTILTFGRVPTSRRVRTPRRQLREGWKLESREEDRRRGRDRAEGKKKTKRRKEG